MKKQIFIFLFIFIKVSVSSQNLLFDNGVYYEKPIYSDTSRYRYSVDNISYKSNMVLLYDYYYIDSFGIKKKFFVSEYEIEDNPLKLADYKKLSDSTIDKIELTISDNLKLFTPIDSTYSQTVGDIQYLNKFGRKMDTLCEHLKRKIPSLVCPNANDASGIIDNSKNLWMHPPRTYAFKILELNPFPFYVIDESIKQWSSSLEVGGAYYLDPRWITWKKSILITWNYKRGKDEIINTPLGKVNCKVVNGTATLKFGQTTKKTYLKSYYNQKYGFVKLDYTNINNSKIVIELESVR